MKHLFNLFWALLAILGAVALAFVTGLVHPEEGVNGLWLVVAAGFYGRGHCCIGMVDAGRQAGTCGGARLGVFSSP